MPRIGWRHNRRQLFLPVSVFPSASAPNATHNVVANGLLDTGATTSALRRDLLSKLNLEKRERKPVQTANGTILADRFLVRLALFPGDYDGEAVGLGAGTAPYMFEREFLVHSLHATFPHEMLIGMDLLGMCDLTIGRRGTARLELP